MQVHPRTDLPEISIEQFKHVMRRFAASVNVITSSNGIVKTGMTATAVCSVSAEPPTALIIVNKSNRSHPVIAETKSFAVNVLSAEQRQIANHFASKHPEPFAEVPHVVGKTGCPIIGGSDAHLECTVMEQLDVGTHTIFVGRIVATGWSEGEPLLYHEGRYVGLGKVPPADGGRRGTEPSANVGRLAQTLTREALAALLGERSVNLRQVLLRAHRGMNRIILTKFSERGYPDITREHVTVLSNMNLDETGVGEIAERAQLPLTGVREFAADLERLGYLQKAMKQPSQASESLRFTDRGWELMLTSFNILREIEAEFRGKLKEGDLEQLRRILGAMFDEA